VAIPKGAYLGAYTGEFITEEEFLRRAAENRWQYMMGLLDCAKPRTGGIATIDGIHGNVFTRMNYAPAEFQNVKFEKTCEAPFVRVVALRDIAAGEELWVEDRIHPNHDGYLIRVRIMRPLLGPPDRKIN
jgi:hypothetical protein